MTDISSLLNEYRVEYHVLQEEMASVRPQLDSLAKLEQQNKQLLEQNQRFMEQLEVRKEDKTFKLINKNVNGDFFSI